VSHEEAHDHLNSVDFMQKLTLNVTHSSKIQQQPKVLRQVLALWTRILLQLYNRIWHKMLADESPCRARKISKNMSNKKNI